MHRSIHLQLDAITVDVVEAAAKPSSSGT